MVIRSDPTAVQFGDVELSTGVRLHYAESGSDDGPVVLFLHGITDSWFSFSGLVSRLPPRFKTYALDQRGHGASERPPHGYAMADFAADAVAFLDAMGVERAGVVGHSMGSFVAQKIAMAHPERLERLVLIGSYTTAANATVLGVRLDVEALADPVPAEFARAFQSSCMHRAVPPPFLERVVVESCKVPARVWRYALDGVLAEQSTGDLHRIQAPTLIVWGDRDAVFAREEQNRLLMGIPDATLRVYTATGHTPHWEQPERFLEDLSLFLQ